MLTVETCNSGGVPNGAISEAESRGRARPAEHGNEARIFALSVWALASMIPGMGSQRLVSHVDTQIVSDTY